MFVCEGGTNKSDPSINNRKLKGGGDQVVVRASNICVCVYLYPHPPPHLPSDCHGGAVVASEMNEYLQSKNRQKCDERQRTMKDPHRPGWNGMWSRNIGQQQPTTQPAIPGG